MPDWLPELSDDDLNTMLDAVEQWEASDPGDTLGDLMELVMSTRPGPDLQDRLNEKKAELQRRHRQEAVARKERGVLLRAKLLTLRERRRVEGVERASSSQPPKPR